MQVRVGDGKRRVLRLRLAALSGGSVPGFVPGVSPVSGETGDSASPPNPGEDPDDTEVMSPVSPVSPVSEGRDPYDDN
jgi:hypothetical protein